MKLKTIGDYLYELQHNRIYWLTKAERKRAVMFVCGILACVTIILFLWLK